MFFSDCGGLPLLFLFCLTATQQPDIDDPTHSQQQEHQRRPTIDQDHGQTHILGQDKGDDRCDRIDQLQSKAGTETAQEALKRVVQLFNGSAEFLRSDLTQPGIITPGPTLQGRVCWSPCLFAKEYGSPA